ncbi:hypothetical protein J6253_09770 [bacterium]|jgi:hypothetical protein|nr:hypothetical protein [bacterium]MBP5591562.1 hypothetical protein [bacterium]
MNPVRFCFKKIVIAAVLCTFSLLFSSCSQKENENKKEPDLTITQSDIMLLIEHKKTIDGITAEYDKKIAESKPNSAYKLIEEGKGEINRYLESKGLKPEVFMKKSKKILRCYLAFNEISEETMQKRIEILKKNDTSEKDLKIKIEAYRKTGEAFFKEMTSGLSGKEIELVRSNLKNIAEVTE